MKVARVTSLDLVGQVVSLGVMIVIAWQTRSVYALAVGNIAGAAVYCALTHIALPGSRDGFRLDPSAVREIIRFGKWIFLSTLIFFFSMQLDKLLFARLFPLDQVGLYSIAASLAVLTPTLMGRLQQMVAFPVYSKVINEGSDLGQAVGRLQLPMMAIGGYMVALSIAGAQSFVNLAYDDRYATAGLYIVILSCGGWFSVIEAMYGAAFLASGNPKWVAIVNGSKVALFCLLVFPATHLWGMAGAAASVVVCDLAKALIAGAYSRRLGIRGHALAILFTAYIGTVGFSIAIATQTWTLVEDKHPAVQLTLQFVLVTALFFPFAGRVSRALRDRSSTS